MIGVSGSTLIRVYPGPGTGERSSAKVQHKHTPSMCGKQNGAGGQIASVHNEACGVLLHNYMLNTYK